MLVFHLLLIVADMLERRRLLDEYNGEFGTQINMINRILFREKKFLQDDLLFSSI